MRIPIEVDAELIRQAMRITGIEDETAVVRAALTALIARTAALRLARLGGTDPTARSAPRRRR
jgi:Arc/MetJ family transcription regulator